MEQYDPITVAPNAVTNEFINLSGEASLTDMQIQKLIYLAHEEWLKTNNKPFLRANPEI